jgi:hypothetical protein
MFFIYLTQELFKENYSIIYILAHNPFRLFFWLPFLTIAVFNMVFIFIAAFSLALHKKITEIY